MKKIFLVCLAVISLNVNTVKASDEITDIKELEYRIFQIYTSTYNFCEIITDAVSADVDKLSVMCDGRNLFNFNTERFSKSEMRTAAIAPFIKKGFFFKGCHVDNDYTLCFVSMK